MPVQTKNPLVMLGNAARLVALIRAGEGLHRPCPQPRAGLLGAVGGAGAPGTPFVATYHGVYNAQLRR